MAQRWGGQTNPSAKLALTLGQEDEVSKFIQSVERRAIKYVEDNRAKFFPGKKGSKVPVGELFNSSIKSSDDFDPVFSAKLLCRTNDQTSEDVITTPCWDMQRKEEIDSNVHLNKGAVVMAVVQPAHIYAINNSAGVTWKVLRVGVQAYESDTPGSNQAEFDFGV